ncbi:MAG TPA: DedA family protein [Haloferula sp.]
MKEIIDFILHIQDHLLEFTAAHGSLIYGLLFLIVFCETGLVVTPFLPGDSLLFAVGALAADPKSGLNVWIAAIVLLAAAILGDTVNYWIGRKFGGWTMRTFPRIVKPSHIAKTHEFFERYGGKTIILARFVPIVRTFAPFVAGSGEMDYKRFMSFNVIGAILWVVLILPAGWFFGNIPIVKKNFELVVLGIIAFSILPMVWEIARAKFAKPKPPVADTTE